MSFTFVFVIGLLTIGYLQDPSISKKNVTFSKQVLVILCSMPSVLICELSQLVSDRARVVKCLNWQMKLGKVWGKSKFQQRAALQRTSNPQPPLSPKVSGNIKQCPCCQLELHCWANFQCFTARFTLGQIWAEMEKRADSENILLSIFWGQC